MFCLQDAADPVEIEVNRAVEPGKREVGCTGNGLNDLSADPK